MSPCLFTNNEIILLYVIFIKSHLWWNQVSFDFLQNDALMMGLCVDWICIAATEGNKITLYGRVSACTTSINNVCTKY